MEALLCVFAMKIIEHQHKLILAASFLLLLFSLIYLFTPHRMAPFFHLDTQIFACDVIVDKIVETDSFVLKEQELLTFYRMLEQTKVHYVGRYGNYHEIHGHRYYHLYFSSKTMFHDTIYLDAEGYLFYEGMTYKLLGDPKTELLTFLNETYEANLDSLAS